MPAVCREPANSSNTATPATHTPSLSPPLWGFPSGRTTVTSRVWASKRSPPRGSLPSSNPPANALNRKPPVRNRQPPSTGVRQIPARYQAVETWLLRTRPWHRTVSAREKSESAGEVAGAAGFVPAQRSPGSPFATPLPPNPPFGAERGALFVLLARGDACRARDLGHIPHPSVFR